jgi:hypothetical protein
MLHGFGGLCETVADIPARWGVLLMRETQQVDGREQGYRSSLLEALEQQNFDAFKEHPGLHSNCRATAKRPCRLP